MFVKPGGGANATSRAAGIFCHPTLTPTHPPSTTMSGKAAPAGKGAAPRGPGGKAPPSKDGVIVSVEEKVWTLRMGAKDPPCNVARFDEMWVGKGDSKRKVRPTSNVAAGFRAVSRGYSNPLLEQLFLSRMGQHAAPWILDYSLSSFLMPITPRSWVVSGEM